MPWALADAVGGEVLTVAAEGAAATFADGAVASAVTDGVVGAAANATVDAGVNATVDGISADTGGVTTGSGGATGGATGTVEAPGATGAQTVQSETQKLAQEILQPSTTSTGNVVKPDTSIFDGSTPTTPTNPVPDQTIKPPGLIDSAVEWATDHPIPAAMVGQTVAGAVGGIGKAALEKEIQQRNIRARSDLVTQQSQQQLAQSAAGTLSNPGGVRVAPGPLRRPDGSLVYPPGGGIINNAVPPS